MISTLHGILFEKTPGSVVIECGGVGYEATIPLGAYNELPAAGSECRLFVRHVVREDDEQLYGFASKDERAVFDMLIEISGVGPKLAICVLGGLSVADFKRCVAEGDVKRLGSVKGIGKKIGKFFEEKCGCYYEDDFDDFDDFEDFELDDEDTYEFDADDMESIIASGDRSLAGKTLPAKGLTLEEVFF